MNTTMAIRNEYPEKYDWWLSELESLGISPKTLNDLNDKREVSELTENLKQTYYAQTRGTKYLFAEIKTM